MLASCHDGLASGIYKSLTYPKGNCFSRFSFIKWLSKINTKLKSQDNIYIPRDSSRDSQVRDGSKTRRSNVKNRSRNKCTNNAGDRSNDRASNGRNYSKQKSNKHCKYCNQDGHTWKYC